MRLAEKLDWKGLKAGTSYLVWSVVMCSGPIWFMWSDFILKLSEVKWVTVKFLGIKSTMYIRVTLYWGYFIILWLFHLGTSCIVVVLTCTLVVLTCTVVVLTCSVMGGFVYVWVYTCFYCVLYCVYCVFCIVSFMYIYSFLFCLY
jgi:hypothetical protein